MEKIIKEIRNTLNIVDEKFVFEMPESRKWLKIAADSTLGSPNIYIRKEKFTSEIIISPECVSRVLPKSKEFEIIKLIACLMESESTMQLLKMELN